MIKSVLGGGGGEWTRRQWSSGTSINLARPWALFFVGFRRRTGSEPARRRRTPAGVAPRRKGHSTQYSDYLERERYDESVNPREFCQRQYISMPDERESAFIEITDKMPDERKRILIRTMRYNADVDGQWRKNVLLLLEAVS